MTREADIIEIDGSQGEGGGQILRSSLTLSMITGKPVRLINIRAGRAKPGLMRQHLTAVKAATEVCSAQVAGAEIGSLELTFEPGAITGGTFEFSIGTAGSCTLVLQTILPALLTADRASTIALEGGTHNPFAPPFDFLKSVFAPQIRRMGPEIELSLERPGFYPASGGRFAVNVTPCDKLTPVDLVERGALKSKNAYAVVSRIPSVVAERELKMIAQKLSWDEACLHVLEETRSPGPGNIVLLKVEHEHVTELFTGFGEKNTRSERVATQAIQQVVHYMSRKAPVGPYLADQLLIPMALGGSGKFRATKLTRHTITNMEVIQEFLPISIRHEEIEPKTFEVSIGE